MNFALILSGGIGRRMGSSIPKQYSIVKDRQIIDYCLEAFNESSVIDAIVVVASMQWQGQINVSGILKFQGFALDGSSRQHSILNGLEKIKSLGCSNDDCVIIHDAVRPNISEELINSCINELAGYDGVMPVLPMKDTIYQSIDSMRISNLLNRNELYAGQSPESFRFGSYYELNKRLTEEQLSLIHGSSEIAIQNGLAVHIIPGDEHNYKITTPFDLERFRREKENSTDNIHSDGFYV